MKSRQNSKTKAARSIVPSAIIHSSSNSKGYNYNNNNSKSNWETMSRITKRNTNHATPYQSNIHRSRHANKAACHGQRNHHSRRRRPRPPAPLIVTHNLIVGPLSVHRQQYVFHNKCRRSWRSVISRNSHKTTWTYTRRVFSARNHRFVTCSAGQPRPSAGRCWRCRATKPAKNWPPKCLNWCKSTWAIARHAMEWVWIPWPLILYRWHWLRCSCATNSTYNCVDRLQRITSANRWYVDGNWWPYACHFCHRRPRSNRHCWSMATSNTVIQIKKCTNFVLRFFFIHFDSQLYEPSSGSLVRR